jgi:hypothetical protein
MANDIHTLSGTQLYPDLNYWKFFDPSQKYKNIYNRYAHVIYYPSDRLETEFNLVQNDVFVVQVNPCNKKLMRTVKVNYFIFNLPYAFSCLDLIEHVQFSNMEFFIYKRIN